MAEPFLPIDESDIAVAAGQVIQLKVDDQGKTLSVVVDCLSTSFETYSRFTMLAESAVGDNGREPVDTAGKYRHRGVESAVTTGWCFRNGTTWAQRMACVGRLLHYTT
jgi:hypothetical protein